MSRRITERKVWSETEIASLRYLRDVEGMSVSEIALALQRPEGGIITKLRDLHYRENVIRRGEWACAARGPSFNAEVFALRDAMRTALDCRSLTAAVFGDPPPGFSALDRMGARS